MRGPSGLTRWQHWFSAVEWPIWTGWCGRLILVAMPTRWQYPSCGPGRRCWRLPGWKWCQMRRRLRGRLSGWMTQDCWWRWQTARCDCPDLRIWQGVRWMWRPWGWCAGKCCRRPRRSILKPSARPKPHGRPPCWRLPLRYRPIRLITAPPMRQGWGCIQPLSTLGLPGKTRCLRLI